jgi:hypothetical protein
LLPPLIILVAATSVGTTQVRGWDGPWGTSIGCGAYCAGEQDAEYDHQNQLQYQPYGQCLPCHSQEYWNNFREGYNGVVIRDNHQIKMPPSMSMEIITPQ